MRLVVVDDVGVAATAAGTEAVFGLGEEVGPRRLPFAVVAALAGWGAPSVGRRLAESLADADGAGGYGQAALADPGTAARHGLSSPPACGRARGDRRPQKGSRSRLARRYRSC